MEDHPTHLFPRLVKAQKLLVQQQPVVLTNPFPHGKHLTQASSSTDGGSQGPPPSSNNSSAANVYMMKGDAYIELGHMITECRNLPKRVKKP
jgi:hypothetical protein